jgi:hypothetical protein
MLVLIASDELRLTAHEGRDFAVDGELVTPVVVPCHNPRCGTCPQAWFGLVSHAPTDAAMVVDRPGVTEADLRRRIHDWLDCQGVIDVIVDAAERGGYSVGGERVDDPVAAVADLVDEHIREIRTICAGYPVGTVVSRFGTLVSARTMADAA